MPNPIRLRGSGVVLRDGKILLIECDDPAVGLHFNIPGGGVEVGEPARDAVRRELKEEASLDVEVGRLLMVWETMQKSGEYKSPDFLHTVGLVFLCSANGSQTPRLPDDPDLYQIGVKWVPISELENVQLFPYIASHLASLLTSPTAETVFYEV